MKRDIDNQTLTEMVSDPAILSIFESFDLTSGTDAKKKRIKEALLKLKRKRLLEADEAEEEDEEEEVEDEDADDMDFDLDEFDDEEGDEIEIEEDDPISKLQQAKDLLDQATSALSGGEGEMDMDMEGEEEAGEEDELDMDLFERKERIREKIRAILEAKKGGKGKDKAAKDKEKAKKAKEKEKADAEKEKDKEKKAKEKEKAAKAKEKEKADKKKKVKEAIARYLLKKRIQERIQAIREAKGIPGKYPTMPKKTQTGIQGKGKVLQPAKPKAAIKGNVKPKVASVSNNKGEAAKLKAGKFPGSPISKQKEADEARREEIKERIKARLAKLRQK